MTEPLDVRCPDCLVAPGTPCTGRYGTHAARTRTATLQAAERGTCAHCGETLLRGLRPGHDPGIHVWHPNEQAAAACPPMPDPRTDWNGYAIARQRGLNHGYPGPDAFIPAAPEAPALIGSGPDLLGAFAEAVDRAREDRASTTGPTCPECRAGKHPICTGEALDPTTDLIVRCACPCPG